MGVVARTPPLCGQKRGSSACARAAFGLVVGTVRASQDSPAGMAAAATHHRYPGVVETPKAGTGSVWGPPWWLDRPGCQDQTARRARTSVDEREENPRRPHRAARTSEHRACSWITPWIQVQRQRSRSSTEVRARSSRNGPWVCAFGPGPCRPRGQAQTSDIVHFAMPRLCRGRR